jgi:hypothetical protein
MRRVCLALAVLMAVRLGAQTFINLGFEQAIIQPRDPTFGFLEWSLAAPGWSHSTGLDTETVYYGATHLGSSQYFLLVDRFSRLHSPLELSHSLAFASGFESGDPAGPWVNAYISQTGLIPVFAQSLRFQATGNFGVGVNNSALTLYPLGGNSYAVDISAYAGTVAELKVLNTSGPLDFTPALVDAFAFSSTPVPEPKGLGVLGLTIVTAWALWRRRYGARSIRLTGTSEYSGDRAAPVHHGLRRDNAKVAVAHL